MRWRSALDIDAQLAISAMVRPQPRHRPEALSISQMSTQGVSIGSRGG
jgi:hypothetical protein